MFYVVLAVLNSGISGPYVIFPTDKTDCPLKCRAESREAIINLALVKVKPQRLNLNA